MFSVCAVGGGVAEACGDVAWGARGESRGRSAWRALAAVGKSWEERWRTCGFGVGGGAGQIGGEGVRFVGRRAVGRARERGAF